ncbi:MAG: hypothetical protein AAGC57_05390 [Pseudomonadota bacterium]
MQALERIATPWMIRPQSPTADLYLLNACRDWVGPDRPIQRLAPGVFVSRETLLVLRHAGGLQTWPERRRRIWLIDDDVEATIADPTTPMGQRLKLRLFERRHGDRLCQDEARIVVSSAALAKIHPGACLIRPSWGLPLADLAHQTEPGPLRLAFLSSAVHRGDLAMLAPVLRAVLDSGRAELFVPANHALGRLRGHPLVRPVAATSWPDWRTWLTRQRMHLALYPLRDTAVNRARSANKIIEHAVVGAAGLYSESWPEASRIARRNAGLVLPSDPEAWRAAIMGLLDDPERRLALATAGRGLAADLTHPGLQRAFWRHAFSLSPKDTS